MMKKNFITQGLKLHKSGNIKAAKRMYLHALKIDKANIQILNLLAGAEFQTGNFEEAVKLFSHIIKINDKLAEIYLYRGDAFVALENFDKAIFDYKKAIELKPLFIEAYNNLANAYSRTNEFEKALNSFSEILSINNEICEVHNNRANVLIELDKFDEALKGYDEAIRINPKFAEAHINRGNLLFILRRYEAAQLSYNAALNLRPNNADIYLNFGRLFLQKGDHEKALELLNKTISIQPKHARAFQHIGDIFAERKIHEEAIRAYSEAAEINPRLDFLDGALAFEMLKICDWRNFFDHKRLIESCLLKDKNVASPFPTLAVTDKPDVQLRASKIWTREKYPPKKISNIYATTVEKNKIKLGYFSSDFRNHPVGYAIAELLELHDRDKFELYGFSIVPTSRDELHSRISRSFSRFFDVSKDSDIDVVKLSRDIGVEIAIDLNGFTRDARTEIFARRCAPIQVNYLGYPGSMGAPYIDYIVADKVLIQPEYRKHFSENIIYMPDSYFVSDRKKYISNQVFSKKELNLPEQGFIYCCFNNSYKILPDVFSSWCRILKSVEGSVLWLRDINELASRNLRTEAKARGIDEQRIIFAGEMPFDEHLARHRCADLFLDTLPYNAHSTASDALWAGLPVLTQTGNSFAGRVASSLLTAIEIPELIAETENDYEKIAIELASNPAKMQNIKMKLTQNRLTTPLFDTLKYTRHLERAYQVMSERYRSGTAAIDIRL